MCIRDRVKVRFDRPHQWDDDLYNDVWAWGLKIDEFGTLRHLQLLEDKPDIQTMTVVVGEPTSQIERSVFEDVATWGVCSLQGWVNSYESARVAYIRFDVSKEDVQATLFMFFSRRNYISNSF